MSPETIDDQIRAVIAQHAQLAVAADALLDDADLYAVGMTSRASVSVMLALEDRFELEFPDRMLRRSVFGSIASIRAAIGELSGAAVA